jgi:magnesium transporter
MIRIHSVKGGAIKPGKFEDIRAPRVTSWVDVVAPTPQELDRIARELDVPLEELQEHSRTDQRPRTHELEHTSLIIAGAVSDPTALKTLPVLILVSAWKDVITIAPRDVPALVRLREQAVKGRMNAFKSATSIVFYLLDEITSDFFKAIDEIEDRLDAVEAQIIRAPTRVKMSHLFTAKKALLYLHKTLSANREVIARIEREHVQRIDKRQVRRFRDLYVDTVQLIDLEETLRDILTGMLDLHVGSISNELNTSMKRFTIVATLLLVPALVAGVYGMNFRHMPELEWAFGYPFALGLMLAAVLLTLGLFRWRKWI